ncbi:dihydroorotate dehydrogenase electron transfer subunit [Candidatus Aerophobetes bacterium]|uniref:Dihydroorotate dehydrogenase B (NAD(+)), electron transfer subunit n=1 Tax=Aerophobetes bacterium TaxID=2030807 RepID=A0A662DCE9_UNCAE|nr:MAG: dihydroorotate dehydrogenase electron transfer subunit [Candidatus Aerophobetes bacterium]
MGQKKNVFFAFTKVKAKVLSNIAIAPNCYKLSLKGPPSLLKADPGQFINIRIGDSFFPLLRRPFSISKLIPGGLEIIYKIVGTGTRILSTTKKGEYLDIIGPLGRGFTILPHVREHILVGGGVGVAPLVFLAQRLIEVKSRISVFLGFKKSEQIICREEFKQNNIVLNIATDDGSFGYRGTVFSMFEDYIGKSSSSNISVYACGPLKMLKSIAMLSLKENIVCQVLLERVIGCGIGACRGCVVEGKRGYLRVCKEGPVFYADEILWNKIIY